MGIANELITRGWTQRRFESDDGSVCLAGAAGYASTGHVSDWTDDVREAMTTVVGKDFVDIAQFNDAPGRTFDEVLRVAELADEILDGMRDRGEL